MNPQPFEAEIGGAAILDVPVSRTVGRLKHGDPDRPPPLSNHGVPVRVEAAARLVEHFDASPVGSYVEQPPRGVYTTKAELVDVVIALLHHGRYAEGRQRNGERGE
jgi:hypothetical protein